MFLPRRRAFISPTRVFINFSFSNSWCFCECVMHYNFCGQTLSLLFLRCFLHFSHEVLFTSAANIRIPIVVYLQLHIFYNFVFLILMWDTFFSLFLVYCGPLDLLTSFACNKFSVMLLELFLLYLLSNFTVICILHFTPCHLWFSTLSLSLFIYLYQSIFLLRYFWCSKKALFPLEPLSFAPPSQYPLPSAPPAQHTA